MVNLWTNRNQLVTQSTTQQTTLFPGQTGLGSYHTDVCPTPTTWTVTYRSCVYVTFTRVTFSLVGHKLSSAPPNKPKLVAPWDTCKSTDPPLLNTQHSTLNSKALFKSARKSANKRKNNHHHQVHAFFADSKRNLTDHSKLVFNFCENTS